MNFDSLVPFLIGPYALLVASLITNWVLYRWLKSEQSARETQHEERLKDAKDTEKLAEATLKVLQRGDGSYERPNR